LIVSHGEKSSTTSLTFYLRGLLQDQYEVSKTVKVIYRNDNDEEEETEEPDDTDDNSNKAPKFIVKSIEQIEIEISYVANIVTKIEING
jgi:hypothetical protein